jgi:hypothetical protein
LIVKTKYEFSKKYFVFTAKKNKKEYRSDPRMMEIKKRKKTGPKPLYGEAKKMVSFRLSPEALTIIKALADKDSLSQAEVLERWARQFKTNVAVELEQFAETEMQSANTTPSTTMVDDIAIGQNRELVGAQR